MLARNLGALTLTALAAWSLTGRNAQAPADAPAQTAQPAAPVAQTNVTSHGLALLPWRERDGHLPALDADVDVLIVTLPDPIASHLDWAFDSHLDGVRRAFERAGYVLDRLVLPWKTDGKEAPKLAGEPGALLFRRRDVADSSRRPDFWLVYVVGELSTRGIDARAFRLALEERSRLAVAGESAHDSADKPAVDLARKTANAARTLRIVGPTFSGASRSLREAVSEARSAGLVSGPVEIVSGSATSSTNEAELERDDADRIRFRSTLHTDEAFLGEFRHLLSEFGLEADQVAILREGTTAYGGAIRSGVKDHLVVPFPMSIGSLRRATTKPAPANSAATTTGVALDTRQSRTALDLTDEPIRLETAGATTKLTPASIDVLLDETTRTLAQRDIKAALLFASDVRDKLFLGCELKKRLPDLQLFTFEGNALYLRPEYNESLRGMVVLSTYPLLLRDTGWLAQTPEVPDENLIFANEGAEGTFNATLVQLERPALLTDYTFGLGARAGTEAERPGIWATVVGATMMLPLTLGEVPAVTTPSTPEAAAPGEGANEVREHGGSIGILILAWIALVTAASFWNARLHRRQCHTRARARRRLAPDTTSIAGKRAEDRARLEQTALAIHRPMYRALLHFAFVSLLLPFVALIAVHEFFASDTGLFASVFALCGTLVSGRILWRDGRTAVTLAARASPFTYAFVRPFESRSPERAEWMPEIVLRLAVAFGAIGFALLSVFLTVQIFDFGFDCAGGDAYELFAHRTVEVDQGLSLLVPLALIGLLAAAWARWHLFRLEGLSRPEPAEAVLDASGVPCNGVWRALFRVLPASRSWLILVAVVPAAAWAWLQLGRTHDGAVFARVGLLPVFDWILGLGILGALVGSVWAAVRLVSVWRAFRAVLVTLAGPSTTLPFADLRQTFGIHVSLGLWPAMHDQELRAMAATRWRVYASESAGRASPLGGGERHLAHLEPRWFDGRSRALPHGVRARHLAALVDTFLRLHPRPTGEKPSSESTPRPLRAVQEVLAAELVLYFDWVVRQLRTLCFFLLLSVVLTTLLVNSYPFRPQELFQTASLFVFGAVVACLVWVIGSMNRNPTLSVASGSKPGELTWDRTLFANLALYGIVPIVAMVTSQQPALRDTLFKWVEPLVRFLVTA